MSSFETKKLPNGETNPKYVDLLDQDPEIAGQKFACMSFVSPEKILKKREVYLFDQFIKQWEFSKSMERYFDFIPTTTYPTIWILSIIYFCRPCMVYPSS